MLSDQSERGSRYVLSGTHTSDQSIFQRYVRTVGRSDQNLFLYGQEPILNDVNLLNRRSSGERKTTLFARTTHSISNCFQERFFDAHWHFLHVHAILSQLKPKTRRRVISDFIV